MMHRSHIAITAALGLALSACGEAEVEEVPTTAEGADAQGEILGGTITDESLPLDQLRSSSPLVKSEGDDGDSSASSDQSSSAPSSSSPAASAASPEPEEPAEAEPETEPEEEG